MKAMYNRYIPQSDGSYRRNQVPDRSAEEASCCREKAPDCSPRPGEQSIGRFFRSLLPRGLDVEDLLIILLLLILSGDSREDHNTALLTLVLYLFL